MGDTLRVRASRDRVTFIRDQRLEADSTLFPYEWPALDRLRLELANLRPALEAGSVRELADALPEVRARADALIAGNTIPALLAPRREEVRGRLVALGDALRMVEELAPAALAAPPDTSYGESEGFAPLDESPDSLGAGAGPTPSAPADLAEPTPGIPADLGQPTPGAPPVLAQPSTEESPAGPPPAAGDATPAGKSAAETAADSLAALDPIGAYLDAWRDLYAHAEALLHRVRDPFGE